MRLDLVPVTGNLMARRGERDVDWRLNRSWEGGRKLAIFAAFGCREPGRFLVRETDESVTVRVVYAPSSGLDGLSTYRRQIDLAAPRGTRPLLHVMG